MTWGGAGQGVLVLGGTLVVLVLLLWILGRIERRSGAILSHHLGCNGVLATAWLGVPLHELSHLGAALLFRHRIVSFSLLDPDPLSGTLGYVRHARRPGSAWQLLGSAVIPVAPVLGGAAALLGLVAWALSPGVLLGLWRATPPLAPGADLPATATTLARHLGAWTSALAAHRTHWLPLQLYLGVCVASHMAPSRADLGNLARALPLPLVLVLGGAAWVTWHGVDPWIIPWAVLPVALAMVVLVAVLQGFYVGGVLLVLRLTRR